MTDNLDELRKQWQKISVNTDNLNAANRQLSERFSHSNVASMQQRLAKRCRWQAFNCLTVPLYSPILYFFLGSPLWMTILYAAFGILMFIVELAFANYIKEKSLVDLPVIEAVKRANTIRSVQKNRWIIGFIIAIPLVLAFVWSLPGDDKTELIIACAIGFIVGLAFSIFILIRDRRLANKIIKSLTDN